MISQRRFCGVGDVGALGLLTKELHKADGKFGLPGPLWSKQVQDREKPELSGDMIPKQRGEIKAETKHWRFLQNTYQFGCVIIK